ncbi:uncharacterized protein [Diabrotica undecimpunctata]|uniref:uncharacterized protein n=1 Tax=Diabrotica undecimpunctata TaxID=50387 RepID=UPI003B63E204
MNITPCEGDDHSLIARVDIKAPEFWRTEPELWFLRLEAQFLNREVLIEVADIVKNPTAGNAYIQLQARLLDRYGTSSDEKIHKLMELTLGNLKPTQLLYRMQVLAMDSISTEVLKNFWLDRLPP